MLLNDFSGGKNTRVTPSMLQPIQAQVYTNIDNSTGAIEPIRDKMLVQPGIGKYFTYYRAGTSFIGSDKESSYVEYRDILYYTRDGELPKKYDGTTTFNLGISEPTASFSAGINTSGNLTGTYTYCYTYYISSTGIESKPSPLSQEVTVSSEDIILQNFVASSDVNVDTIRIYRIGGNLTQYTLVDTKANDGASYIDNIADITIAGNYVLDTYTNGTPPIDSKYFTEHLAILFTASNDKLYYSKIGEFDYWPSTNFIDFNDTIIGMAKLQDKLLVFTKYETYVISGNSPETFSKYLFDAEQGCISHYSIDFTNNTLMWLSTDGICATSGGLIEVISLPILGIMDLQGIGNSAVYNRSYYLTHNNGILVFDFRYNTIVRDIDILGSWLVYANDKLYISVGGDIYEMFSGDKLSYTYVSPIITEGSYSTLKYYKDFYIRYNGEATLKLYIDSKHINTKYLTGDKTVNLKALNSANGYGLTIEITGTASIYEINYKVEGPQK